MSVPEKITPIGDLGLGDILPGGPPDMQVSILPFVLHVQTTSRFLDDPQHPAYSLRPKPQPGDFLAPYGDERFACYSGAKGFLFQVAMIAPRWWRRDLAGDIVSTPFYTQPKDLVWLPNPDNPGKKICIAAETGDPSTDEIHARTADRYDRQTLAFMLVEGAYPVIFCFASTNREAGDDLGRRTSYWKVTSKDGPKPAPMLGLFRMTSERVSNDRGRWFAPRWAYVAKSGDKNGPSAEWTRRAAELRSSLKGEGVFEAPVGPEPPEPPPEIEQAIERPRGSASYTTGKQPRPPDQVRGYASRRDEAPPPDSADDYGRRDIDDTDIPFN
jgi:hypothetical protein